MFDVITFGSATQDILVTPKKVTVLKYQKTNDSHVSGQQVCFPFGSKVDISDIAFNSGGGGTNAAATFALQRFKTAFCGTVGKDASAEQILKELQSLHIDTGLVKKTSEKSTNHSIVIVGEEHDRTILVYRGASELMSKDDIPWTSLKATWLYLAPLTGILCDNFESLVNYAAEHGMKIAVNPSIAQLSLPKELLEKIFQKVDVLILNQEEASFLTKVPFEQEKEIFRQINQLHPKITVMTRGGDGVIVSDGNQMYSAVPPKDREGG
jgi:sugar/nucleoside kinase (ribokinase family)